MNAPPQISVTPAAKRYIQENGIIDISFVHHAPDVACCLGVTHEVLVAEEAPKKTENFYDFQSEGVNLYIDRELLMSNKLRLKLRGVFKKRLDLDGLVCKAI